MGCQFSQHASDVCLPDPGETAVGAVHLAECIDDQLQLWCDYAGVGVGEQSLGGFAQPAPLAAAAAVEFGLVAAVGAVDVEPDAAAPPARGPAPR